MATQNDGELIILIERELDRIEEDCIHSGKAQFNAGERFNSYHYWLGVPAVIASALAGTAFFQNLPVLGGVLATLTAVLTALQTFLKPSERASAHKSAGDQYLALRNDARVFRQIKLQHVCDRQSAVDGLDEFTSRRREMNLAAPQFANRDFQKAKKGIDAGEAAHQIDGGSAR